MSWEEGGAVRVLHVDDTPKLATLTAELLEREDDRFSVTVATTAHEGLERLAETRYDCVVSDYSMPGMTGFEFLEAVREKRPEIPFILFTARGPEEVDDRAIDLGVSAYQQKQVGTEQYELLAENIRQAVEGTRAVDRAARTRQELRQYQRVVECSEALIAAVDTDRTYLFANGTFLEYHDLAREDLVGEHVADVLGEEGYDVVAPRLDRALDGERVQYEMSLAFDDGEERHFDVRYYPLTDDDGAIDGVVAEMLDVTDRIEREAELELFRSLVDNSLDGITVVDPETGGVVDANRASCEMLGYTREELLTLTVPDFHPDYSGDAWDEFAESVRTEGERVLEGTHQRKDGSTFPVEIKVRRVSLDSEYFVGAIRDVTDREERERELETQNERLGEFASIVSHDLRNPLNVATVALELAAADGGDDDLETARNALERMAELIDELLTLAQVGEPPTDVETVELAETAEACWRNVATADATLVTGSASTVRANESRLGQLLENLYRNAIEHGGSGVTVTVGDLDGEAGFYVEDDGPGVPETERDRIFESGYSTHEDGTGFGLSIVRDVAAGHDWEVRVTEGTAGGTRFEIRTAGYDGGTSV